MLIELKVKNFAIIESLEISFRSGLNVISGETGSGKSVLLKSLALLMGEKALADTVRSGAEQALIEGCFDLSGRSDIVSQLTAMGVECEEDLLVVRRLVSTQGKSKVYLNGHLSAVTNLRDIVSPLITVTGHTAPLIEMTGQHENRHLQSKAYHMDLVDRYSGGWNLRQEFGARFFRLSELKQELLGIREQGRQREQRLDFLRFQREEISGLNLKSGEDLELEANYLRLKNSARLAEFSEMAETGLYSQDDSVLVRLHQILQRAAELANLDPELSKRLEGLSQAKSLIEDSVYELREYARGLEGDPGILDRIEERLSAIRKLQKKFGAGIEEILAELARIETEIASLESCETRIEDLEREVAQLELELKARAEDLHQRRQSGARLLEKGVNDELAELNMKGVMFVIRLSRLEEMNANGSSEIEFLIQNSKKDEPRPLARVASGGELSRILLALKRVVGLSDQPRTYLFDEVDTGVSGQTAEKVGRKLHEISEGQQVICVTHLPQVAAFADHHLVIEKTSLKGGAQMRIQALGKKERVKEIARLISGEKITQTSLDHAQQLLREVH